MARVFGFIVVILAVGACTRRSETVGVGSSAGADAATSPVSSSPAVPPVKIVFLGDSLTEGLGVTRAQAFPALVGDALKAKGRSVEIINAGVSGSTTASGPSRMKWLLKGNPTIVFLALGANDGLRGFPIEETKKNLTETVKLAKAAGTKVLLAGMEVPPNYGPDYARKFRGVFAEVAKEQRVALLPFLLEGVAGEPELNGSDRIHPNPKGHEKMSESVLRYLEPLL